MVTAVKNQNPIFKAFYKKTQIEFWNYLIKVPDSRSTYRLARLQLEKIKQEKDELVYEFMTKYML